MDLGLRDKVALVAAASRGLGKAAALELAREGARLAICSRSEGIHMAAAEIRSQTGSEVVAWQADVTEAAQVQHLVASVLDRFGQIDILVANAGGPPPGPFLSWSEADWMNAFRLTVLSTVHLCAAVLPSMVARGSGSIVATQSYLVKQPVDNMVLSNSLRLAVVGLMKTLANEYGPTGVRVNVINPGWTWTERVQALMEDRARRSGDTAQAEAARLTAAIPLRRMASVEEYGRAIAWLASPAASYLHGHALTYDGGLTQVPL